MPTVWIETPRAKVSLAGQKLVVEGIRETDPASGEKPRLARLREIPLRDIDHVAYREDVTVTSRAVAELLKRGIALHLFSTRGRYLGATLPEPLPKSLERSRQYAQCSRPEFCLRGARSLIAAKIYNQRRVLQRLASTRETEEPETGPLTRQFHAAQQAESIESLLGHEGTAGAHFYQVWSRWLPEAFPFERRSRRPPHNPVNACLSYLSTLLYAETVAAIHSIGLDPGMGLFHATENGRWSLALDLIEPFRPVMCEAFTLDLLNRGILKPGEFEPRQGGVYLSGAGRRKLILQYEKRMTREFISEQTGERTTVRRRLRSQPEAFRRTLEGGTALEPFRVN